MTTKTCLYNDNKFEQVIDPAVYTSDQTSDEIDMQGYQDLAIVANVGVSADSLSGSVYIALELQHSDTSGSGYAACADTDLVNPVTSVNTGSFAKIDDDAEDNAIFKTAYKGTKRFVKVVVNMVGSHSSGCPVSVTAIKGRAAAMPVNS